MDHAVLRALWSNHARVAEGVYRSNHPSPRRLRALHARGIRTIINLRGATQAAPYLLEKEVCDELGIEMIDVRLMARRAARREHMLSLIEAFRTAQKPFLIHCKSGADRAGLASAIYLIEMEGRPVAEARKQLSARYLHFGWTSTGVLDHILDLYEAAQRESGMGFETWLRTAYDNEAINRAYFPK